MKAFLKKRMHMEVQLIKELVAAMYTLCLLLSCVVIITMLVRLLA